MNKGQKALVIILALIIVGGVYFLFFRGPKYRPDRQININEPGQPVEDASPKNEGPVSPISGLPCENWNRRALAVMQPGDVTARPAAGFSEADMVIEMPVITASITRLMAIYICNTPAETGSM